MTNVDMQEKVLVVVVDAIENDQHIFSQLEDTKISIRVHKQQR